MNRTLTGHETTMRDFSGQGPSGPDLTFDHVALSVQDLSRMKDWYMAALGLTPDGTFELPERSSSGVLLKSPTGFRIELIRKTGSHPARTSGPGEALLRQGINHFCLRVTDLDSAVARLVNLGAQVIIAPTASAFPGERMCYIGDPEGNLIELMDIPGTRTPASA